MDRASQMPESRRSVVVVATPDDALCSLIVLRLGYGRRALVAVSHHGALESTAVLRADQVADLIGALMHAAR